MSLSEAMSEVKSSVVKGAALDAGLIVEIAKDYDLNPKLLERKIAEAGWTEEKLRAFAASTDPKVVFAAKLQKILEKEQSRLTHNPNKTRFTVFVYKGETYTYLGSYNGSEHLCVAHSNAAKYVLNTSAMRNSTFMEEAQKKAA